MTDVATPVEDTTEQTETGETSENGTSKRNTAPIQITVPLDLKATIKAKADEANLSEARWVLELVAEKIGYELAPAQARGATRPGALFPKTLTADQKKERFDAARILLAALDKGEVDLEALKAKLGV